MKFEVEKSNAIHYLDVKITTTEDFHHKLETTIYRKSNRSREIINTRCKIPYNF